MFRNGLLQSLFFNPATYRHVSSLLPRLLPAQACHLDSPSFATGCPNSFVAKRHCAKKIFSVASATRVRSRCA